MASWYKISLTHSQVDAWGQHRIMEAFARYGLLSSDASDMALFASASTPEGLTLYFSPACYPHCSDFIYRHTRYAVSPCEKPTAPVILLAGEQMADQQDAWQRFGLVHA